MGWLHASYKLTIDLVDENNVSIHEGGFTLSVTLGALVILPKVKLSILPPLQLHGWGDGGATVPRV